MISAVSNARPLRRRFLLKCLALKFLPKCLFLLLKPKRSLNASAPRGRAELPGLARLGDFRQATGRTGANEGILCEDASIGSSRTDRHAGTSIIDSHDSLTHPLKKSLHPSYQRTSSMVEGSQSAMPGNTATSTTAPHIRT